MESILLGFKRTVNYLARYCNKGIIVTINASDQLLSKSIDGARHNRGDSGSLVQS